MLGIEQRGSVRRPRGELRRGIWRRAALVWPAKRQHRPLLGRQRFRAERRTRSHTLCRCLGGIRTHLRTADRRHRSMLGRAKVRTVGRAGPCRFSAVSVGGLHSCGLRTGGTIECWGLNIDADGNEFGQAEPPSGTFVAVSAGWLHSCGVRTDGTIQCWGSNTHSQTEPPAGTFSAIDTGGNFTTGSGLSCGLRTDAAVRCWGFRRASS